MNKKTVLILAFFLLVNLYLANNVNAQNKPNDQYYNNQWYLNKIGYNFVWDKVLLGEKIVVAVIDSGVNINHPDLEERIWLNKFEISDNGIDDDNNGFIDDVNGWDFVLNDFDPSPKKGALSSSDGLNHGTIIAGIISAKSNNGIGVSGIASNARIMPLRALNEWGEGKINDVIRAMDYAINNGADIINLSFSGLSYNQGFKEAIERAHRAGVIVVAAAGNNGGNLDTNPLYPACFTGSGDKNIVLGVAGTDTLDQKATFSSYGQKCVDISAPGISFFSTYFYDIDNQRNKYYDGYWSGTSMSTAVVSGSLAVIKGVNPKLNNDQVLEVLLKSSDNINSLNPDYGSSLGSGRVNLLNSVNWALEKWENLGGYFLLFPQSNIQKYKNEFELFNTIRFVRKKGKEAGRFFAYSPDFNGTISITSGDLDNDGSEEIVVGAGEGGGPHVRIFNNQGELIGQFFAYDAKFRGGVNVALGDINGDGKTEIITSPGPSGGPHIRIFDNQGILQGQFFAYDAKFNGGVNLAVGDLNGDNKSEIITVPASNGGPHVKIFDGQGNLTGHFFAYEEDYFGGVKIKTANIYGKDNKGNKDIVVSPGANREPEIRIFDIYGQKIKSFLAYSSNFRNGVNLSVGDLDKDGLDEVITGAGPGGAPHVRAFNGKGELVDSFYGLESSYTGGVVVDFIEIKE
jgi:hypothetical protein